MTERRNWRSFLGLAVALAILAACGGGGEPAEEADDGRFRKYAAGIAAHHLCSGTFVVGRVTERSPETVLAEDIAPFVGFAWQDDFEWEVDTDAKSATVWAADVAPRTAKYHGDQGCTLLEDGADSVRFTPVPVPRDQPPADEQDWPRGDIGAEEPDQAGVDRAALDAALDAAMGTEEQNTRALAVVRHGKIVGERYAPGFTRNTPQISWSEGKSVTATLIGVLMQKGHFGLDDPAPVAEWREEGDPRGVILMRHLLTMSSGLDMTMLGLNGPESLVPENEHMRVYFDALNVFEHASGQPYGIPPGTEFRYRNSDPLTLGRIVRETVETGGKEYLTHPQRMLFDRIGSRDFVLEPDPWGNFILSGYEYGSAADWMRFGLLHLWDGVFEGDRILPEGWSEFVSSPSPGAKEGEYGGLWWLNLGGRYPDIPDRRLLGLGIHGADDHGDPVPGRGDRPPRPESGGLRPLPERHGFRDSGRLRPVPVESNSAGGTPDDGTTELALFSGTGGCACAPCRMRRRGRTRGGGR